MLNSPRRKAKSRHRYKLCKGGDSEIGGGRRPQVKKQIRAKNLVIDAISNAYARYLRTGQRSDLIKAAELAKANNIKLSKIKNAIFNSPEYERMIYSRYAKYLNPADAREIADLDIKYRISNDPNDSRELLAELVRKDVYKKYVFDTLAKTPDFKFLVKQKARTIK